MPNINSQDIGKVSLPLSQGFDIGTLVTELLNTQLEDKNVTKAEVNWIKKNFIGKALNFFRLSKSKKDNF